VKPHFSSTRIDGRLVGMQAASMRCRLSSPNSVGSSTRSAVVM
jgi:hypothetical protein